jgi:hypothetical protein
VRTTATSAIKILINAKGNQLDTLFSAQTTIRYSVTGKGFFSMIGKAAEDGMILA